MLEESLAKGKTPYRIHSYITIQKNINKQNIVHSNTPEDMIIMGLHKVQQRYSYAKQISIP